MPTVLPLTDKAEGRLAEVAAWLEAGAPHEIHHGLPIDGFDMDFGVQIYNGCGAVCCIAGALVQFNSPRKPGDTMDNGEVEWKQVRTLAVELLGMQPTLENIRLTNQLFRSDCDNEWITPAIAAQVLRHLIATREVDWEAFRP